MMVRVLKGNKRKLGYSVGDFMDDTLGSVANALESTVEFTGDRIEAVADLGGDLLSTEFYTDFASDPMGSLKSLGGDLLDISGIADIGEFLPDWLKKEISLYVLDTYGTELSKEDSEIPLNLKAKIHSGTESTVALLTASFSPVFQAGAVALSFAFVEETLNYWWEQSKEWARNQLELWKNEGLTDFQVAMRLKGEWDAAKANEKKINEAIEKELRKNAMLLKGAYEYQKSIDAQEAALNASQKAAAAAVQAEKLKAEWLAEEKKKGFGTLGLLGTGLYLLTSVV